MLFYPRQLASVDPTAFAQHRQEIAMRRARYGGFFPGAPPTPKACQAHNSGGQRSPPPRPQQDRGLNENYGREVMELHTVGVDAGYTQDDVIKKMAKTAHRLDRARAAP